MAKQRLPKDANGFAVNIMPSSVALARTVNATLSSTQEITLNAETDMLRVYAISQDVYLKWGTDDVTASNFDQVIPAGQILDFLSLPVDSATGEKFTAVNLIERSSGATVIVIEF